MEEPSATGMLTGGAAQFEQFVNALQRRLTECELEMKEAKTAQSDRDKDLEKLKEDLRLTRQSNVDLSKTVDDLSSKVTNQANTFANIRESVMRLQQILDGPPDFSFATIRKELSALKQTCETHQRSINELDAVQGSNEQQLNRLQSAVDQQRPIVDVFGVMWNPGQVMAAQMQAVPYPDGHASNSRPAVTIKSPNTSRSTNTKPLPPPPPAVEAPAQQPERTHRRTIKPPHEFTRQQSTVSSFTLDEMSPRTAYTYLPMTSDPLTSEGLEEEDDEEDDQVLQEVGENIVVSRKRRATQPEPIEHGNDSTTPMSLKRRRAGSNLKRTTSDPQKHATSEEMMMRTPPMASKAPNNRPKSSSSNIEMPSWYNNMDDTPQTSMTNPLQGWDSRVNKVSKLQKKEVARQPQPPGDVEEAEETVNGTDQGLADVPASSQRRSKRAPKKKIPFAGQQFFSGKVPDYAKGGEREELVVEHCSVDSLLEAKR